MVPQHRALRIVKIVFVAFGLFLFVVLHLMDAHHPAGVLKLTHKMIAALALADVVLGMVFERYFMKAPTGPMANGTVSMVAQRYFTAHVIRLAFTMSTCLLGLVVHTLGAPRWLGRTLVGVGVLFMMMMRTGKTSKEAASSEQKLVANSR